MRTPSFWQKNNWISKLLTPLGELYALGTRIRLKTKKTHKVKIPVICIGNLTAGGTGKTPTAISLAVLLQNAGLYPNFLSRGYHGTVQNVQVNCTTHTPQQVGDEPLLLARIAPTFINADRYQGALMAQHNQAECILMDDGFQNPSLYKDLSFIVIDGTIGFGNGKCIPAGPLREHITDGLKRAQAALIIGDDNFNLSTSLNIPCFKGKIIPELPDLQNNRVVAFAGIGRPQKFYTSLNELGIEIVKTFDFPDHHYYSEDELNTVLTEAELLNAEAITTTKDFVKIPPALQSRFKVLEIRMQWEDSEKLKNFILSYIRKPK
ncbi:MAG: tetraacyldisaccharide 4'-kinase [Alphaproteobacteria bacterium]|nr:tetraacyldisaccharide 4'-kinase [Alphaproteobacteria bacterium]